jgi:hypothetical protein
VPTGQKALTVTPAKVRVQVLNGTGTPGEAKKAAALLTKAGFVVVGTGNAKNAPVATTSITYGKAYSESARTLAYAAGVTTPTVSGTGRTLVLTVGTDWAGTLKAVVVPDASSTTTVKTADKAVCSS